MKKFSKTPLEDAIFANENSTLKSFMDKENFVLSNNEPIRGGTK